MERDEPRWGEPPPADMIAELLVERFPIGKGERIEIDVGEEEHRISLVLTAGRHLYRIGVEYLRGAGSRDPWLVMVDALDNLFGALIESGRAYRELPSGEDVEFEEAFFRVRVEHEMPEMERIADQLLKEE
jgi:hypothetical protein